MMSALSDESYFLSASNAASTSDQQQVENRALAIAALPEVRAAMERTAHYWRAAMQPDWDRGAQAMFDAAVEEYAFNYILKAAASDAAYPCIAQIFLPAHDCFGVNIPGSRIGGDNPDNIYRFVGIEYGADYLLHGKVEADSPVNVSYTLTANYGCTKTVATIENHELVIDDSGYFTISIDARPAEGRINHLQARPGTCFLFIRDSLSDWDRQRANRLRIERLTPPDRDPLTIAQMGALAADNMLDHTPLYYWYQRTCQFPINDMTAAFRSGNVGGLLTQAGSFGGFRLGLDDALLVRINPGGARYHSIVAHDMYYRTIDADQRSSSRNIGQTHYGADGVATYIFSHRDPGVANWIDTAGLPGTIILQRWQALPGGDLRASSEASHVKLADLDHLLHANVQSVTSTERARELAARKRAYDRRLISA